MQCCLEPFGQYCIEFFLMHCCLEPLELFERFQKTMRKKTSCANCLNTLAKTLHSWKPYAMLHKRLQTTLYKNKSNIIA